MNIIWNIFALFCAAAPQDYPDHVGVVNDFANEIDPSTKAKIEQVIADVKAKVDVRLVVVTVTSLGGKTVEDYTIGLTKKWGVGQKGKNNGILFLHAPKEHKIRIENGYGVESRLTDIESKMIIQDTIIPLMKASKFAEAMLRGSEEILKVVSAPEKQPEKKSAPISRPAKGDGIGVGGTVMIVGVIAVILIFVFIFVMGNKDVEQSRRSNTSTYTRPAPRPVEPLSVDPMAGLLTGAVLGSMLGNQPPPIPQAPMSPPDPSIAAAFLADQERRRRRKQEDEEEEERSRRSYSSPSSDDSSSSSSSSSDSGSSSSDSFSGGDSGGGGASGEY